MKAAGISTSVAVALALSAVAAAGCGRGVTEDDCVKIRDNMRDAWAAEAKKAAPATTAGPDAAARNEKAAAVIRSEGERLATDWMVECRKDLIGRRAEPKEMDCLLQAKTLGAINKCSEL
jgi:hypothetical protein